MTVDLRGFEIFATVLQASIFTLPAATCIDGALNPGHRRRRAMSSGSAPGLSLRQHP